MDHTDRRYYAISNYILRKAKAERKEYLSRKESVKHYEDLE